jgi:hypothetical protein
LRENLLEELNRKLFFGGQFAHLQDGPTELRAMPRSISARRAYSLRLERFISSRSVELR